MLWLKNVCVIKGYKRSLRKSCCENSNAHIEITDVARGLEVVKVIKPADVLDEATVVSITLKKEPAW